MRSKYGAKQFGSDILLVKPKTKGEQNEYVKERDGGLQDPP